jgi:hypothetical protein
MKFSKFIASFLLPTAFCLLPTCLSAQEVEKIKIVKEDPFYRADFDETEYKVFALDKYGNPYMDVVKSFKITFQDTKGHFESAVVGNTFPKKTINYLTKGRSKATNICLKEIVAEDKDGHVQKLPDRCGILIYPDCKNCDPNKQQKK